MRYMTPTKAQEKEFKRWLKERPKSVRLAARKYPPGYVYLLKTTGQKVVIIAYTEEDDGSCSKCRVLVPLEFNPHLSFQREVFGIKLSDLASIPEGN